VRKANLIVEEGSVLLYPDLPATRWRGLRTLPELESLADVLILDLNHEADVLAAKTVPETSRMNSKGRALHFDRLSKSAGPNA
jgi:hypothetical protein